MREAFPRGRFAAPIAFLLIALAVLALLRLPVGLPVGPMYWDLAVYVDGGHRVALGQVPSVDFFAPVGPLAYWLFAALQAIAPNAHPLLVAQWSPLPITLPVMIFVFHAVRREGEAGLLRAWVLLGAFLFFSLLPFNTRAFSAFPGSDAFGIYNRHGAELLFVLASVLLFVRGRWLLPILLAIVLAAMFLLKVTAFLGGGLLCIAALVTGTVHRRDAFVAASVFGAGLLALELATGAVSAYVFDVLALATKNQGGFAGRFVQSGSLWIAVLLPIALLGALLLARWRREEHFDAIVWLGAGALAGLFFESQNTGSQGFIHLWPIVVALSSRAVLRRPALAILAALALLPGASVVAEQALRAYAGMVRHVEGDAEALGPLGRVTAKRETARRADAMAEHYAAHRPAYAALARRGWLPGPDSYAEHDFQLLWLREAARAVEAVRILERREGVHFVSVFALNFANPYAAALGRDAPRHVAIGADVSRAVPTPDAIVLSAIGGADLILRPTCPVTAANEDLLRLYEPAMRLHRRFDLTPCTEAWAHPRFGELSPSATSGSR